MKKGISYKRAGFPRFHVNLVIDKIRAFCSSFNLESIWDFISKPSNKIKGDLEANRARLLSIFIFCAIPFLIIFLKLLTPYISATLPEIEHPLRISVSIYFPLLILAYGLSRTKWYSLSVFLVLTTVIVSMMLFIFLSQGKALVALPLFGLTVPFACIFLSLILANIYGLLSILALVLTWAIFPSIEPVLLFIPISFSVLSLFIFNFINTYQTKKSLELIENEQKYSTLVEHARSGVAIIQDDKLVFVNNTICKLSGYSRKELLQKNIFKLINPHDRKKLLRRMRRLLEGRISSITLECVVLHKNGKKVEVELSFEKILFQGDLAYMVLIRDISAQKLTVRSLVRARDLAERSRRTKEEFLATATHEIRTPLNGLIGMMELLSKTRLNARQKEYINAMSFAGNNLLTVINDLLDFSRLDSGKIELQDRRFKLRELLAEVFRQVSPRLDRKKRVQMMLEIEDNVPDRLMGDSMKLNQILLNLVDNAIKYTDKGFIKIHVSQAKEHKDKVTLRFIVKDSGVGIKKKDFDVIFESFTRTDTARDKGVVGSGLGLAIVKRFVEAQRGKITIASTVGQGSSFTIDLPYKTTSFKMENQKQNIKKQNIKKKLKGLRALLVEDHEISQIIAEKILRKYKIRVTSVRDGKSAVKRVGADNSEKFDLLILDMQLPKMNGYEVAKKIRASKNQNVKKIPIIALTAHAYEKEKQKAYRAGVDDYLAKPYTAQDLISKILKNI